MIRWMWQTSSGMPAVYLPSCIIQGSSGLIVSCLHISIYPTFPWTMYIGCCNNLFFQSIPGVQNSLWKTVLFCVLWTPTLFYFPWVSFHLSSFFFHHQVLLVQLFNILSYTELLDHLSLFCPVELAVPFLLICPHMSGKKSVKSLLLSLCPP